MIMMMMLWFECCVKWTSASCLVQDSMGGMDSLQQPTQISVGTPENAVFLSGDLIFLSRQVVVQTSRQRWPSLLHC